MLETAAPGVLKIITFTEFGHYLRDYHNVNPPNRGSFGRFGCNVIFSLGNCHRNFHDLVGYKIGSLDHFHTSELFPPLSTKHCIESCSVFLLDYLSGLIVGY
jgi:hypothetical protein